VTVLAGNHTTKRNRITMTDIKVVFGVYKLTNEKKVHQKRFIKKITEDNVPTKYKFKIEQKE